MGELTLAPTLLELRGATYAYGTQQALGPVDLEVRAEEILAIVGPNGAGKSTLLGLASGWLTPVAGRVSVGGESVGSYGARALARMLGGVASEPLPASKLRVREAVSLGRHPWRGAFAAEEAKDRALVDAALRALDLRALAERPLEALSSGERARVALARCAAQDAPLWLLDEPTAHLDLGHVRDAVTWLRHERDTHGRGIVVVLHDLHLAARIADRVCLLVEGRVHACGAPAEVLTPEHVAAAFGAAVRTVLDPDDGTPLLVLDLQDGGAA